MLKPINKKKAKTLVLALSFSLAFTVVGPALTANAENTLSNLESSATGQFDVSASQAVSEIDSVGVEDVTEENGQTTPRLLKAAAFKNKVYSYKRGGFAAWCKDYVSYRYNGTSVAENNTWQEAGYIFPNIIKKKGIVNYANGSSYKDYRGTKTYKIGTPTPWGDVAFAQFDRSDYYRVKSNGTGYLK
ncbi:lacticin RM [Listeria booriae]|uniref:lacticin RM n=1 Tax=Listeria booriae TaxID=1552123 RepID=UPI00162462D6|nr:lacticin RM [Listeria booriae]MBC2103671.1 lacticin RM [Listeria booriae]